MANIAEPERGDGDDRRTFLQSCGRFALTVPPVMTVLLSTSLNSPAIAQSTAIGGTPEGGAPGTGTETGSGSSGPEKLAPSSMPAQEQPGYVAPESGEPNGSGATAERTADEWTWSGEQAGSERR